MNGLEWKKILCPIDFSDASRDALKVAAGVARRFGGSLTLFHAYPLPGYTLPEGTVLPSTEMLQALGDETQAMLDRWKAEAAALGVAEVTTGKAVGEPATAILDAVASGRHDLVVVATHGRTGLAHMLLGSVAERVVRRCPVPVLTVRPAPRR